MHRDPLWKTTKQSKGFDDVWFYHCDHLGTPQEMSDHTGAIIWKAEYKAWGECRTEKAKSNFFENSEIISNNIRFQGQYFDQETGLHYNRYRYYSPYVGRFVSKDPITLLGGNNFYLYTANPIKYIDPIGLATRIGCKFHSFTDVILPKDKLFASDGVQFRIANKEFIKKMETNPKYRKDMLRRHPDLAVWLKSPNMSNSPPGLTWHHNDQSGLLNLVDRGDHANNHGIYHPDGTGGRDKWGGGKPGRQGKLDQATGCPL